MYSVSIHLFDESVGHSFSVSPMAVESLGAHTW